MAWNKKQKEEIDLEEKLSQQYLSCLDRFFKKIRCKIPLDEIYMIRDCMRENIWRTNHYPAYKSNRTSSEIGKYVRMLNENMHPKFKQIIRVDDAEADDIVAILVKLFSKIYPERQIYLIATDSDYNQLLTFDNLTIYSPKGGWQIIECEDPVAFLAEKVAAGDKTDNIPRAYNNNQLRRNAQLIDFNYIPRHIQDSVIRQLKDKIPDNFKPMNVQLGLCCLNTQLRKQEIFCSRNIVIKTIKDKGINELKSRCLRNCRDLIKYINWNAENGIRVMRISSDIFPHKSNVDKIGEYSLDFAQDLLEQAGAAARHYKQRLTFHPGQYNVVGTPYEDKFQKTILDLDWQADVLDRMGMDQDSVMVVHGGGLYGDKAKTIQRWIDNFKRLPERVQRRLVLENCEKCFHIEDCLYISEQCNIPTVFDTHHFDCYKILHPKESFLSAAEYIPKILATWNRRHIKPKFHVSEQAPGGQTGKHSDLIETLPDYLLNIVQPIDIMIEAKLKEQAIFKLYEKYPQLDPRSNSVKSTALKPKLRIKITAKASIKPKLNITKKKPKLKIILGKKSLT